MSYDDIFLKAIEKEPYPYQTAFAEAERIPKVLSVPTGVGKTATVILGWLFRRFYTTEAVQKITPRRLVYCLPMRTLVEQTERAAREWIDKSDLPRPVGVHVLMGGADAGDWDEYPEQETILIGTQDMLLSRALNRGYGMSRYRWPMHYALLNNDCLWVLDETQLMGVGLTTSVQLAGLRSAKDLPVFGTAHTLWMSATLDREGLATVDHPAAAINEAEDVLTLTDEDRADDRVNKLLTAKKPLQKCAVSLSANNQKEYERDLSKAIAEAVEQDPQKSLTLVIVNRVQRAQEVYRKLQKLFPGDEQSPEVCLIHSRFRKADRRHVQESALDDKNIPRSGRIVVATQAIEAGVDLSATTLFTELAPWSSLVQRFGRCNRRGTCDHARVFWIDIEPPENKKSDDSAMPYASDELAVAREHLQALDDVGPRSLEQVLHQEPWPIVHTLRRKDLLELWDTTPDLAGNDLDISRYIRDSDNTDVQVYWRSWPGKRPPENPKECGEDGRLLFPPAARDELCAVSVRQFREFLKKHPKSAWRWNPLDYRWDQIHSTDVRPGNIVLLHIDAGGYDDRLGWTSNPANKPTEVNIEQAKNCHDDAHDDDAVGDSPVKLTDHLQRVADEAKKNKEWSREFLGEDWTEAITTAALWHDVGKAHPAFQNAMRAGMDGKNNTESLWAKSGGKGRLRYTMGESNENNAKEKARPGFRHELASALAWLAEADGRDDADLIAYLIAAHHGKVRGSIRSLPIETPPSDPQTRFARGIWDGDVIPAVDLGNGQSTSKVEIDLSLMELGEYIDKNNNRRPSWRARVGRLLEEFGPFQLAYLEMLVRVADWRGSENKGDA